MTPMSLPHPYASTHMQHDLLGSTRDPDLRSDYKADLSRSPRICFDAPRRDKDDENKIIHLTLLVQKIFEKHF